VRDQFRLIGKTAAHTANIRLLLSLQQRELQLLIDACDIIGSAVRWYRCHNISVRWVLSKSSTGLL